MKRILFTTLICLNSFYINGLGFQCEGISRKDLAKELIKLHLSGVNIDSMSSSTCLKQSEFKYIMTSHFASSDEPSTPDYIVDFNDVTVSKIVPLDEYGLLFKAFFKLKVSGKLVVDEIQFMMNEGKDGERRGCASTIKEPQKRYAWKKCIVKK